MKDIIVEYIGGFIVMILIIALCYLALSMPYILTGEMLDFS